jgi:hypothetical protein
MNNYFEKALRILMTPTPFIPFIRDSPTGEKGGDLPHSDNFWRMAA